jgi:hypothetical protein
MNEPNQKVSKLTKNQKIGIGVGIGIGVLVLGSVLYFVFKGKDTPKPVDKTSAKSPASGAGATSGAGSVGATSGAGSVGAGSVGATSGAGSIGAGSVGAGSVGAGSVGAGSVGAGSVGAGSVGASGVGAGSGAGSVGATPVENTDPIIITGNNDATVVINNKKFFIYTQGNRGQQKGCWTLDDIPDGPNKLMVNGATIVKSIKLPADVKATAYATTGKVNGWNDLCNQTTLGEIPAGMTRKFLPTDNVVGFIFQKAL